MDNEKVTIDWGGTRGAVWTGAGALIGLLAQRSGLLGGNGILGGGTPCEVATQRDLGYERELTKANAEIGQLKAEKYADAGILAAERRLADKIERIETAMNAATTTQAVLNAKQEAFIGGLAAQVASFDRMTARYINPVVMNVSEAAAKALPSPTNGGGTGL
jgi:hypothetical protein